MFKIKSITSAEFKVSLNKKLKDKNKTGDPNKRILFFNDIILLLP